MFNMMQNQVLKIILLSIAGMVLFTIGCAMQGGKVVVENMDYLDEQLKYPVFSLDEIVQKVNTRDEYINTIKSKHKITFQDRVNNKKRNVKGFVAWNTMLTC